MPYYDSDGHELSGPNDASARGEWIYTETGARVRSASGRRNDVMDSIAANQRVTTQPHGGYDGTNAVVWIFTIVFITLPIKAIQVVLWCTKIGWRSGGSTFRSTMHGLAARGTRPWLAAICASIAAMLIFGAVTVGLVAYVLYGLTAVISMDSNAMSGWVAILIVFFVARFAWNAWRRARSP